MTHVILQLIDISGGNALSEVYKDYRAYKQGFMHSILLIDVNKVGEKFIEMLKKYNGETLFFEPQNGMDWDTLHTIFKHGGTPNYKGIYMDKFVLRDKKYTQSINKIYEDYNVVGHYNLFISDI